MDPNETHERTDTTTPATSAATQSPLRAMKKELSIFGLVIAALLLIALYVSERSWQSYPAFNLTELESTIYPDPSLHLTYSVVRTAGIGNVLWMTTEEMKASSPNCYLGAFFYIDKNSPDAKGFTEDALNEALAKEDDIASRVKELETLYLVFEPSETTCTSDTENEMRQRNLLWKSLETARE